MKVSRKSPLTGKWNSMDLDITEEQVQRWINREAAIQEIFPNLTADEREFIKTGYTPEDWNKIFPPEEEEPE